MKRFEYIRVQVMFEDIDTALNKYGQDGWQVVDSRHCTEEMRYLLMREIES